MDVGICIAAVSYLCHALSGRAVELVLEDVDIARRLYHAVGASLRRSLLVVDSVAATANQAHDEIYRILELPLVALLAVALAHRIRNAGQKVVQQVVEILRFAMMQSFLQLCSPTVRLCRRMEIARCKDGEEARSYLMVGEVELILNYS